MHQHWHLNRVSLCRSVYLAAAQAVYRTQYNYLYIYNGLRLSILWLSRWLKCTLHSWEYTLSQSFDHLLYPINHWSGLLDSRHIYPPHLWKPNYQYFQPKIEHRIRRVGNNLSTCTWKEILCSFILWFQPNLGRIWYSVFLMIMELYTNL